ncbi:MAG: NTP transferase domain-containing protein [Nitrospinota bacterium]
MVVSAGASGIVLAAGLSTRLRRNKLLLPMGPKPVVAWTVENAMAAPLEEVIVVTGHEREEIEAALRHLPVRIVYNPDYAQGQSTSLKAGVRASSSQSGCFVIFLGDQPLVGPEIVAALLERFRRDDPLLVVPVFSGKRGNPVLVSAMLRGTLLSMTGDAGARPLLEAHADSVASLEVHTPAVRMDIDREEDYEACLRVFETGPVLPAP